MTKGHEDPLGIMSMFTILIIVSLVYTHVKTYQIEQF